MRRVVRNERPALLGCPAFEGITLAQVQSAMAAVYGGPATDHVRVSQRSRTVEGSPRRPRTLEVARDGGRIAFTTSPASLFTLYRALAEPPTGRRQGLRGGGVAIVRRAQPDAPRLRWLDRVAMVSDGRAPRRERRNMRPRSCRSRSAIRSLVVADRTFAGTPLAAGAEVVAVQASTHSRSRWPSGGASRCARCRSTSGARPAPTSPSSSCSSKRNEAAERPHGATAVTVTLVGPLFATPAAPAYAHPAGKRKWKG